MYSIKTTKQFKTDFKKLNYQEQKDVQEIVNQLEAGKQLPEKARDHPLKGKMRGLRDCHVRPDLILIYSKEEQLKLIKLIRVGNHNNLQLSALQRNFANISNNVIKDSGD